MLGCWQSKLVSYRDRLILINSVLTSLPMFILSFQEIPKGVQKDLISIAQDFFLAKLPVQIEIYTHKWNIICKPKDQ
jgi:hypothetical protein